MPIIDLLEILLGQIPEAIYFALFMIFVKELKSRRTLFTVLMILEYVLLLNAFPYSVWSHILYFVVSYILMKVLYKDTIQITDIFTLGISSVFLMIISIIAVLIFRQTIYTYIINRFLMFAFLFIFRKRLHSINKLYYKFWNRNDKPKKIKSTTFRAANLVILNISFAVINVCMILAVFLK